MSKFLVGRNSRGLAAWELDDFGRGMEIALAGIEAMHPAMRRYTTFQVVEAKSVRSVEIVESDNG